MGSDGILVTGTHVVGTDPLSDLVVGRAGVGAAHPQAARAASCRT